jgi:hypothetical protein
VGHGEADAEDDDDPSSHASRDVGVGKRERKKVLCASSQGEEGCHGEKMERGGGWRLCE